MRLMKYLAAFPLATALLMFGLSGSASAAPKWQPIPVTAGPSDECPGFTLYWTPIHFDGRQTTTVRRDGTVVWSDEGASTWSVTRVDTGTTLVVNLSGPGTTTFDPNTNIFTSDLRGHNTVVTASSGLSGLPPVILVTGHLQYSVDTATGTLLSYSLAGTTYDFCAMFSG